MKRLKNVLFLIAATTLLPLASSASVDDLKSKSWDQVISQAKKEGKVNFNVWYLQPRWRDFVKPFEEEYGIKVNIAEGTLDAQFNKLLSDRSNPVGKIDVMAIAASRFPLAKTNNTLAELNWIPNYSGGIHIVEGVDTQGYGLAFWGNQTGFAYDPDRVNEQDLPQTLDQLTSWVEKNPKMFGYNDPNNGGAGNAFIQRMAVLTGGNFDSTSTTIDPAVINNWGKTWQWFADNKENVELTGSGADSITRLNDGEFVIVPAWEDHLAGLQKSGAITSRLKFYIPEFGMLGGGNILGLPVNTENPAAAALFINWLTSAEVQKKLNQEFGTVPMHEGVVAESPLKDEKQRANQVITFSNEYSAELKKQFVQQVMMK